MDKKVIAIHQPNYLPWLGYFYKMWCSDIFIFHDNVEITKKGYTRRTNIRQGQSAEKTYLTVPLQKHSDYALIKTLQVASDQNWPQKHLNKIRATYQSAPYFDKYFPEIQAVLLAKKESLSDLNIALIQKIADLLIITPEFYSSSELPVKGKGSEYNLALCQHFETTHYVCGKGSKNYQDDTAFQSADILVVYNDFYTFMTSENYDQNNQVFINGLSIVDALFYVGAEGIQKLFQKYSKNEEVLNFK